MASDVVLDGEITVLFHDLMHALGVPIHTRFDAPWGCNCYW